MKELIDRIIGEFDFEKVHRAMLAVNWYWLRAGGTPSVGTLMTRAQELLQEASEMDVGCSVGTGGFRATKIEDEFDEDGGEGLKLEFILTECEFCTKWLNEE